MEPDETFIRLAIEQARFALARGEEPVGAVVTRGGEVLAAAHNGPIALRDPSAHAEMLAIRRAAEKTGNFRLAGATLYVTLEPCAHTGRTPPCVGALVAAGVARVVVAIEDPDPRVNGAGVAALRAAGVRVEVGCLASEAVALNRGFLMRLTAGRPIAV